ncbi:MAG: hypothetical protein JNK93_09685 [Planctomycetia bacterium]|nr:hypothetical protein [Planctomycetia bacterium]
MFHTIMGHDVKQTNGVGFAVTYQRGTEWAATGKVTQEVPGQIPLARQGSSRQVT